MCVKFLQKRVYTYVYTCIYIMSGGLSLETHVVRVVPEQT